MTAPSPAGLSPLLDQLDVRISPDRKLVALRASDTEPRWRVSNGGHYRDRDVHGWPSLTAAVRAGLDLADELDQELADRGVLLDRVVRPGDRIRSVLAAALTPGADTAGATA